MADGKVDSPQGEAFSPQPGGAGRRQANLLNPQRFPLRLAMAFYAGMIVLAVLWRGWWDGQLPWTAPGADVLPLSVRLGAGVGVGLLGVLLSHLWTEHSDRGRRLSAELARILGPIGFGTAWLLALASGLGEELLFRGAAQPTLGIWIASLLFAAVHYLPGPGLWIWTLYAFAAGLALGLLYEWTGDALAPVTAHAVLNGVNLSWLGRRNRLAARPD